MLMLIVVDYIPQIDFFLILLRPGRTLLVYKALPMF